MDTEYMPLGEYPALDSITIPRTKSESTNRSGVEILGTANGACCIELMSKSTDHEQE